MDSVELIEAKRQRDSFANRLKLMREGRYTTNILEGGREIDTTGATIPQVEQSIAALDRKIARLEAANAHRT